MSVSDISFCVVYANSRKLAVFKSVHILTVWFTLFGFLKYMTIIVVRSYIRPTKATFKESPLYVSARENFYLFCRRHV